MKRQLTKFLGSAGILAVVLLGPSRALHPAAASPAPPGASPTSNVVPIVRRDGASKPTKPQPPGLDPTIARPVADCVLAAYRELEAEVPALSATYAGNPEGFAIAYALRKQAMVGDAALATRGCKPHGGG